MSDRIPCKSKDCENTILPATAERTGGYCMPCFKNKESLAWTIIRAPFMFLWLIIKKSYCTLQGIISPNCLVHDQKIVFNYGAGVDLPNLSELTYDDDEWEHYEKIVDKTFPNHANRAGTGKLAGVCPICQKEFIKYLNAYYDRNEEALREDITSE